MPRCSLDTNLPTSKIPETALRDIMYVLQKSLSKQAEYCVSIINSGVKMTLGGSNEPFAIVSFVSIGGLGPEENKKHIVTVTDYVHKTLGIPKNKVFVFFQPNTPETCGFLGTTFYDLCINEKGARLKS